MKWDESDIDNSLFAESWLSLVGCVLRSRAQTIRICAGISWSSLCEYPPVYVAADRKSKMVYLAVFVIVGMNLIQIDLIGLAFEGL